MIFLEHITQNDSYWFYKSIISDKEIQKSIIGLPLNLCLSDCKKQIRVLYDSYIIYLGARRIGFISCKNNQIAYWLLKSYRNKGYCQIALKILLSIYPNSKFHANPINENSKHIVYKFKLEAQR